MLQAVRLTSDYVVLFEQARRDAKLLDKEFSETGRLKGPLHGVPVSLKDQCVLGN